MNFEFNEKIGTIVQCTNIINLNIEPRQYFNSYQSEVMPYHIDLAKKSLDSAREKDNNIHNTNLENIEFNKIIIHNLKMIMSIIGIPESYRVRDTKSRARFPKYINKESGIISDIHQFIKVNDNHAYAMNEYERKSKILDRYSQEVIERENNKKILKDKETKKIKEQKEFIKLCIKYNTPDDADEQELYEIIIDKDKKLRLALAMLSVREDWNDGCGPVEYALGQYKIEDDIDNEIYDCVSEMINIFNDDRDGRYFRDCKYNYDTLFTMVDGELYTDAMKVKGMIDRY
jgi:hypothetical protein